MMSGIINIGAGDAVDVIMGGRVTDKAYQWLKEKETNFLQSVSETSRHYFEKAKSLYETISTLDAERLLRNLSIKKETVEDFSIGYLSGVEQIQTANPVMQRWIMACPEIRERFLDERLEGYGEGYDNVQGDSVRDSQYDYRRVMDGVVYTDDNIARVKNYYEELPEGERELTLFEKVDIINTWNRVQYYLNLHEEDPTSTVGNLL